MSNLSWIFFLFQIKQMHAVYENICTTYDQCDYHISVVSGNGKSVRWRKNSIFLLHGIAEATRDRKRMI